MELFNKDRLYQGKNGLPNLKVEFIVVVVSITAKTAFKHAY
jgi:hypothetical protein